MNSLPLKHSSLRITGGSLKGRTITVPPGIIRPAMDKMRESLFSILGDLTGNSFLDLFSGSGIIALEAASRGASHIELVESDKKKLRTLINNCNISPIHIQCHSMPVELFIKRAECVFNYIFCDPPFAYQYKNDLVCKIGSSPLMDKSSLLMIHYPKKEKYYLQDNENIVVLQDSRIYGNSVINFYKIKI